MTNNEREALADTLNEVGFWGSGEEVGTEEIAVLVPEAVEALLVAGFRRPTTSATVSAEQVRTIAKALDSDHVNLLSIALPGALRAAGIKVQS